MRRSSFVRRFRRLPIVWWLAAAVLATVVGVTVTNSVARAEDAVARYEGLVHVTVATRSLEAGTELTAADVRSESRPRAFLAQSDATAAPVGRVTSVPVIEGEVFFVDKLAPSGSSPLAAMLRPGERAINVPSNEATPPVAVGDVVDAVGSIDNGDPTGGSTALLLSHGARVIAVGEDAVTVAVAEAEAPRIASGVTRGRVTLTVSTPFGA